VRTWIHHSTEPWPSLGWSSVEVPVQTSIGWAGSSSRSAAFKRHGVHGVLRHWGVVWQCAPSHSVHDSSSDLANMSVAVENKLVTALHLISWFLCSAVFRDWPLRLLFWTDPRSRKRFIKAGDSRLANRKSLSDFDLRFVLTDQFTIFLFLFTSKFRRSTHAKTK
jgi:hypothetical protein